MDISIIIVNYNSKYFLENSLKSINNATFNLKFEIIIIDNASRDGSTDFIKNNYKNILLIENTKNIGYSKACNQGLKIAKGDFLLILNPDTLLTENSLNKLIGYLKKNKKTSMLSCKILNPDCTIDPVCHRSFPTIWNSLCHFLKIDKLFSSVKYFSSYNMLYKSDDESFEVDAISGSFMIFRRDIIDKNIFFSEDYFLYGEDIDFCYKIKKLGYKIEYVPITEVIHFRGQSSKHNKFDTLKNFYKSMNIFINKNYSPKLSFLSKPLINNGIFLFFLFSLAKKFFLKFIMQIFDIISYITALIIAVNLHKPIIKFISNYIHLNKSEISLELYTIISMIYVLIFLIVLNINRNYTFERFNNKKLFLSFFIIWSVNGSITYFLKFFAYSRIVLIFILFLSCLFMYLWRFFLMKKFHFLLFKTLIIGIDENSKDLINYETELANDGFKIYGFVDTQKTNSGKLIGKFPIYGNIDTLFDALISEKIECIIFSLKSIDLKFYYKYKDFLEERKIESKFLPDLINIKNQKVHFFEISDKKI
ncbi:MAG: glycosyltransferase [Spirochaetes bacterium]|nr:glycosyltransferase [Spirochaetota bacterium]